MIQPGSESTLTPISNTLLPFEATFQIQHYPCLLVLGAGCDSSLYGSVCFTFRKQWEKLFSLVSQHLEWMLLLWVGNSCPASSPIVKGLIAALVMNQVRIVPLFVFINVFANINTCVLVCACMLWQRAFVIPPPPSVRDRGTAFRLLP